MAVARVSLARALSKLGLCSRSRATEWILAGRVAVDGRVRKEPSFRIDPARHRITIDGRAPAAQPGVYLMLHKPRGLVTTASDERGRATVYDCLRAANLPWVAPVGRLDRESEGLLLFTNDTRWADRLLSPGSHVPRVYHVQIDGPVGETLIASLTHGLEVPRFGRLAAREAGRLPRVGPDWIHVVLDEGRNRHIRRMLQSLGVTVIRLIRKSIGPVELGRLGPGEVRKLTVAEIDALTRAAGMAQSRGRRP